MKKTRATSLKHKKENEPRRSSKAPRSLKVKQAEVGVLMGSETDLKWMRDCISALTDFGVLFETKIISAHRTPNELASYASLAASRGVRVLIAGAGGAAHLPGMLAAHTTLPVIGVPCPVGALLGEDALWSIVQMPKGVPVATVAIGAGWNAGVLATQILAANDSKSAKSLQKKLQNYKTKMTKQVAKMNEMLTRM